MEPRQLLAADPLYVGAVYIEEDIGSDVHGDTFEITFEGGAEDTQLTRLSIRTDQNLAGLSGGDLIFDTREAGLGADHAFPFTLVALQTADPQASVRATVDDGGLLLVLELTGFHAGDKLTFTIDVDEVQGFDPAETDFARDQREYRSAGVRRRVSGFAAERGLLRPALPQCRGERPVQEPLRCRADRHGARLAGR